MAHFASAILKNGGDFIAPASVADRVTALEKEVVALRVMVTHLMERQLTVTKSSNAMTPAEKQRAYRARLKAGKKESTDA